MRHPTQDSKERAAFDAIMGKVAAGTGLIVNPNRRWWAEDRIRGAMKRAGAASPADFLRQIADAEALDALASELAVGETYFFRDAKQLNFIRQTILPDIARQRGRSHPARAWSAGCASGEEAHTLAILFEQEGVPNWSLLGTDISDTALAKAQKGRYANWSFRGETIDRADSYFIQHADGRQVVRRLADRICWRQLNLVTGRYPAEENGTTGCDLILCRNVLIYFEPPIVRAVQERLLAALADGGWLVLGSSDPPMPAIDGYETVLSDAGLFYRRKQGAGVGAVVPSQSIERAKPLEGWAVVQPAIPPMRTPVEAAVIAWSPSEPAIIAPPAVPPAATPDDTLADEASWIRIVRENARCGDVAAALQAASDGAAQLPLSAELHHLSAILLLGLGRYEEAARAAKRVIYIDRSLTFGHVTLGTILQRLDRNGEAARAYRNALGLLERAQPDAVVALSDGQTVQRLIGAVSTQLAALERVGSGAA